MAIAYLTLIAECIIFNTLSNISNFRADINEALALIIIMLNIIVVTIIGIYKISNGDKNIVSILLLAFILRISLLLIDMYGREIFVLPNSGIDTEMFHNVAMTFPNFKFENNPYSYLVGVIYKFAMNQRIIAQYFNLLLSMSTISISIKIMDIIGINYKVKIAMISIISLIPNYIILSVILLRESVMIFFISLSLLQFIIWWKKNKILNFILAILLVLIASVFHSGVIGNAVGYLIVFILFNSKDRHLNISINSMVLSLFIISTAIVFFSNESNIFTSKFGNIEDINDITYRSEVAESGGSAYVVGGEVNSLKDLIKNSPVRMFYFITSPLPWMWRGLNDIIAFLFSALFYLISYIYAIKTLKFKQKSHRSNLILSILIICLSGAFIFAWGTSNAGTAMRHRDKFIVNYIIMIGLSIDTLFKNKRELL